MLLTTSRAARILDCSEGTVRRLGLSGKLQIQRTSSGVRLYDADDVARLAAERQVSRAEAGDDEAA